jgi:hypothetical protein
MFRAESHSRLHTAPIATSLQVNPSAHLRIGQQGLPCPPQVSQNASLAPLMHNSAPLHVRGLPEQQGWFSPPHVDGGGGGGGGGGAPQAFPAQAVPPGHVVPLGEAQGEPLPEHLTAGKDIPPVQRPGEQTVEEPYERQAPWPSQVPSFPQVVGSALRHPASVVPAFTGAHWPSALPVADARHEVQSPLHAPLQQRPSTQKPLEH